MDESSEKSSSSPKKKTIGVYTPPNRRSTGDKNVKKELPPKCCEEMEEKETPPINEKKLSPANNPSKFINFSEGLLDPKLLRPDLAPLRDKTRTKSKVCGDRIPVSNRTIAAKQTGTRSQRNLAEEAKTDSHRDFGESWRKTEEPPSSAQPPATKTTLQQFHANTVPYIDSHCHTDFIYTYFSHRKNHHDGIKQWTVEHTDAFPRSFAGFIANFIQPNLFVLNCDTENTTYDMEWVEKEITGSEFYLGTTWGCHPHHAQTWGKSFLFWETLEHILENAHRFKVRAVGECGIDLHRCISDLDIQKEVFERHVQLAFKFRLPLVVHCRNGSQGKSEEICLEILSDVMKKNHSNLKIHRHCYTEDWPTALKWLNKCPDVHFGFTPAVLTFKPSQLEAIRRIPMDRILLETDAPYFKPKAFEKVGPNKCSLPGMAITVAYRIAEIKGLPVEEVLRSTYNNTRRVYQLPIY